MSRELTIALVGASGVVGAEFLRTMEERETPVKELRLLATSRSAGQTRRFRGEELTIEETTPAAFEGADVAFISASTAASQELCPIARDAGAVAFDDSSAFRQAPGVPLVVPEVNGVDLRDHAGIIATPNCSTVPLVLALWPLMAERTIRRVIADTYQSTSGAGTAAMAELTDQIGALMDERPVVIENFPKQIAFNAIPQVDVFQEDGYTKEEWKMLVESRKILHQPALPLSATCVRIPTLVSHAIAVHVDFDAPLAAAEARALWGGQAGLTVVDDPVNGGYPTPLDCAAQDAVFVGRARQDVSSPNGLAFWCVTDNLRKGAALNIVQMVEWMLEDGCL
ncbi:MAG: aspartate-semialdehyde dehydrogenase [Chloroflexi bacterium]|nr:MAG: aspartate-semialdehyde dehydrogenase [Chloroflexota bacterium]